MTPSRLRIGIIADITGAIPPRYYGGVERIVAMLVEELVQRGHQVTLFASDDSQVPCRLVPFGHRRSSQRSIEIRQTLTLYAQLLRLTPTFDLVHCFGRTLYLLPLLPFSVPKIQSYGCPVQRRNLERVTRVARNSITFTACSKACAYNVTDIGRWEVIYNAILLRQYAFVPSVPADAPLVFLGRLDRVKGVHSAIRIAQTLGRSLIIAGNVAADGENRTYYEQEIIPHIDGLQISYIGPVNDTQKNALLGSAAALLFPIEWEEPFGLVMIEAMACGTPVVAFRRGAVPEVVEHGFNGFVCDTFDEMIAGVQNINLIDRKNCRNTVELRFSSAKMADDYIRLYESILSRVPGVHV